MQNNIFSEVEPLIDSFLDGYNTCIFAYGATGSGKTFTMFGNKSNPGVSIRALDRVYDWCSSSSVDYELTMCMLEIYNGEIRDLLNYEKKSLKIRGTDR